MEGCGVMPTVHIPLILIWHQKSRSIRHNSLHIGRTRYCSALAEWPEEPWYDEACSRPGSASFLAKLQPTPGGRHCLHVVQLRWKVGHPCLGSRLTFGPKHAKSGSCHDSELASPWPQHPLGPKRLPCHVLYGVGHCYGHKVTSKHTRRPWQHLISQDLEVPMPVHGSIHHDQLTPPPMLDCTPYHDWRAMISIIRLGAGINLLPTPHPDLTVTAV